jgi:hypothetical protein
VVGDSHPREMTIYPPLAGKQNSAYGPTALLSMSPSSKPYPAQWEQVADLRVFRTTSEEWEKLIGWRADMRKRGWKLLRVSSEGTEMVAIFGRTKDDRGHAAEPA